MEQAGIAPEIRHLANTAATLCTAPEIHFELTRPGIGLYGYEPDPAMGTPARHTASDPGHDACRRSSARSRMWRPATASPTAAPT